MNNIMMIEYESLGIKMVALYDDRDITEDEIAKQELLDYNMDSPYLVKMTKQQYSNVFRSLKDNKD